MTLQSPIEGRGLARRRCQIAVVWLMLAFASSSSAQPAARQVLVLNSFERGSAIQNLFAGRFRTELGRHSSEPLNVFEVSLQPVLSAENPRETRIIDYLRATFAGQRLDLVVTLGAPAASFARQHREQLFPSTPLLLAAVDRRLVQRGAGATTDTALAVVTDPYRVVNDALRLLPDTTTVFVVIGASRIEEYWRHELKRMLQPFEPRVTFVFSNDLSFEDMLSRASSLPPHSAIFYTLLSVDAKGVMQSDAQTLAELHAVANAPVFGLYDIQLGQGVVGGSMLSVEEVVQDSARVAVRLLQGESPDQITTRDHMHGHPTFDWRELQRWGISEARLPAGSTVRFRQATLWDRYKAYIVGVGLLIALQSALIGGLIVQRGRRRRTEVALRQSEQQHRATARQNEDLAGRLITAQEAERTRIARDLHDDVSQQLAGLSIAFSGLKQQLVDYQIRDDLRQELAAFQQQTLAVARNVRNLSHDLHPTALLHLGLIKGLTSYCAQLERTHGIAIACHADGDFSSVSPHAALCVYRIAQEALRNVVAHAAATRVDVEVRHAHDRVDIVVTDDGRGFDSAKAADAGKGLGLVSISERAKIAGGAVTIVTAPGKGTRVQARVPAMTSPDTNGDPRTEGQVA